MKFSEMLIPTLREVPSDAEVVSHQLMLRSGMIRKIAAGIYTYLPLGLRVIQNVERIIRQEMNAAGAQELLLPVVMPKELWIESKRWDVYGKELLRFKDRHEREFCFGPTHEEAITDLVRNEIRSYRQLPVSLYQIQTKFRDEIRPRFGLMRGREFLMKDCYSFDRDEKSAIETYWRMYEAYRRIFTRCGLTFVPVEAGTGEIGGTLSHEFHVLANSGEDEVFVTETGDLGYSVDKVPADKKDPKTGTPLKSYRGIEVGQVFHLGTKYSEAFQASYLDPEGQSRLIVMGCYGIGVGRTAAAAIEQNHDEKGIIWPRALSPFPVSVIPLGGPETEMSKAALEITAALEREGVEVLLDDRPETAGVKLNDADLLGIPWRVVVGKKGIEKGEVEVKERKSGVVTPIARASAVSHVLTKVRGA
ncbi:MAG TPA: proline--tRNA ligase [bacterium]|nr:proline--tRNA ligase [bacterium]